MSDSDRRGLSGFALIAIATGIAGIAAYVVTWVVPRLIGGVDYKVFAVFWAALYLVVTALSGIQQEVTRATRPIGTPGAEHSSRARTFGIVVAAGVFVVTIASAPLWVNTVFPELGWALVFPLAVGLASYVFVATLCGSLYGLSEFRSLALLIVLDPVLRLVVVGTVALLGGDLVALAWAAAIPFGATLLILWPFIRGSVAGRTQLDVGYRDLSWNVSRTLVASGSTGALVSGLPLLISVSAAAESPALLSSLFLTITLTRAPLVVSLMSLQGYLIVHFRDNLPHMLADLRKYLLLIGGAAIVLAAAGWWLGPPIFEWLFPGEPVLDGWFFAVLVASSALLGALCVTAPAVLANGAHTIYSLGWLIATVVTVVALALPMDLLARTSLALLVGPAAGFVTHLIYLVRQKQ
ncbi:MAG TPA: hypothetical protein VGP24_03175 [Glaciihabitans sp.]|jgi:hypothetical protein|nr:hypothetical protein [Glaciihabitans sp.]